MRLAHQGGLQPYVTWALDDECDARGGRAFADQFEAALDLLER
jgi:hypothetical protein